MTNRHRLWVDHAGARIALARWGDADSSKPPALLVHGTGFVAEVWDEVARELASKYTVYGIDRRGHGASHKPSLEHYHFLDFASDICAVVEALDLTDIFGVGHSAGATDLLLAAKLLPRRFSAAVRDGADHHGSARDEDRDSGAERTGNRLRAGRAAPPAPSSTAPPPLRSAFARRRRSRDWSETSLWAYVRHGFEPLPDGRVRLLCTPEIEAAMLRPIFEAMAQVYAGDERGNPFASLSGIECPVRVATAEKSWPIYKEMADRAVALIPDVSRWTFEGVGHCVAQEAPGMVLEALAAFEDGASLVACERRDPYAVTSMLWMV